MSQNPMNISEAPTKLVDARNIDALEAEILEAMAPASLIGLDIETHDKDRHEGLNRIMKVDEDGRKSKAKKLVFDTRRTTLCGLSIWPLGSLYSYYFNLGHADVHNRIPFERVQRILSARKVGAYWVIHNAAFENVMLKTTVGYTVEDYVCSMQLAVSHHGPDEYRIEDLVRAEFPEMINLFKKAQKVFIDWDGKSEMTPAQADILSSLTSKDSDAPHSYPGAIDTISPGYGLKRLVYNLFGHKMATFEDTLGDAVTMGDLTGEQVSAYGGGDAFWCTQVFMHLVNDIRDTRPLLWKTFREQEMPCVQLFADMQRTGWKIDINAIHKRKITEREELATALRELRKQVRTFLPFPPTPHEGLTKHDATSYGKRGGKNRTKIEAWANKKDSSNALIEIERTSGSMIKSIGVTPPADAVNFTYWEIVRVLIYDLLREKVMLSHGKVQSDSDHRGAMRAKLMKRMVQGGEDTTRHMAVLEQLSIISQKEQGNKLYIQPHLDLTDPETGKVYPITSSKLATRRMSMESPSGQHLAKHTPLVWIRSYYNPDEEFGDDEVLVSSDWSSIELVGVAERSKGRAMKEIFGTLPYKDMHTATAADILGVMIPEMTQELFGKLGKMTAEEIDAINPLILRQTSGVKMEPGAAKKYWRTECGKVANFNYWYSGFLSSIGENLGWSMEQTQEATERYRARFPDEEQWRVSVIENTRRLGYVELPDYHRRYRFEATEAWWDIMMTKIGPTINSRGMENFAKYVLRKIQKRAANQAVNYEIQGLCAALMKRAASKLHAISKREKFFRIKGLIHDEIVSSVKLRMVPEYARIARDCMTKGHEELFPTLPLNCSTSVGISFAPYHPVKFPSGQIELDEAPSVPWLPTEWHGKPLPPEGVTKVLDYLQEQKEKIRGGVAG